MNRSGPEPKPPWERVPGAVRREVETILGSRIRRGVRVWGGYVPTATFRLFLADDRTAIFKGTNASSTEFMREILVDEERVYRELGSSLQPCAPAYYGSVRHASWHVLLLEDVGPAQVPPWTDQYARAAMRDYAAFHRSTLGREDWPDWLRRNGVKTFAIGWKQVLADTVGLDDVAALAGRRAREARSWLDEYVPTLAELGGRLLTAPAPHALLHLDTRSDNLRIQSGKRLRLFDWPYTSLGPPEFDLVAFVQSIWVEDGPHPETCVAWYAEGLAVRSEVVDASLAAVTGFFADRARQPPLPGAPRVRSIQRRQLRACLAWCAQRFGWQTPGWIEAIQP
ncbi:MAG: phosphotransferase [Chloroflexi bacterium]|nr:phosphotransferase [Chloroflexota bacterium]